jgi:hypothetical protein
VPLPFLELSGAIIARHASEAKPWLHVKCNNSSVHCVHLSP